MNRHTTPRPQPRKVAIWSTIAAAALATVVGAGIAFAQSGWTVHSGVDADGHTGDWPDSIPTAKLPAPPPEPDADPRPIPALESAPPVAGPTAGPTTAPVPAPIEPAPIEPAPIEPAPIEPAPIEEVSPEDPTATPTRTDGGS